MHRLTRDGSGVAHVQADDRKETCFGMGYAHAMDRGLQILLMRILGEGRLGETLDASDASLAVDRFFRKMNWKGGAESQVALLSPPTRELSQAYCDGINRRLEQSAPWELRLLGYRPEPWRIEDSILISRMMAYVALAQSQAEIERLLVEMVQGGVPRQKLEALFPGLLEGLDEQLLRQVRLGERIVPESVRWLSAAPRMMASNNWVVSGRLTASGQPVLANDPHLETNRLPNVWYEIVLRTEGRYAMGASMPGLPGVLIGRNRELAWGATYSFMDTVDSWIEHCRDNKYLRQVDGRDEWVRFRDRREVILRKGKPPLELVFHENDHGVLEGDPGQEGLYLTTRWSASASGARSLEALFELWDADSVEQGREILGRFETAWNFVLADRRGNIGYQMSGLMPRRREGTSGFLPLPGWKPENGWQGFVPHDELPRALNPPEGFFATANEDLNRYGKAKPINMPMGPYRGDRIRHVLSKARGLAPEHFFELQHDVHSLQAERFLAVLRPLLPDTEQGRLLRGWDCGYGPASKGAYLFERFYQELLLAVFGGNGLGSEVAGHLARESGTFVDFYDNFDRVLLSEDSPWFDGLPRDEVFRSVAARALATEPRPWGDVQKLSLAHILFGGKLPRWLGFDRGPVTVRGGRATVHQGQIYRSAGRTTSFVPSFRMVVELDKDEIRTSLAGGPSDRRFSKWYCSGLADWEAGRYKTIRDVQ